MLMFNQFISVNLGMYFINLEIYHNEKWITVHSKINACSLQYIYIFCSFSALIIPLIVIACDFVFMYPSPKGKKTFILGNILSWCLLPFATILSSGQDNLKQQLCKKNLQLLWLQEEVQLKCHLKMKTYLTKKMHQILMRTLYEVSYVELWLQLLLEQFLFHQFQECK